MFRDLAEAHRALAASFPVDERVTIGGPQAQSLTPGEVMCLVDLRKFVEQGGVYLPSVAKAMCNVHSTRPDLPEGMEVRLAQAGARPWSIFHQGSDGEQRPIAPDDTVWDALYGLHLHGDYDRWQRIRSLPEELVQFQLATWQLDVETLLEELLTALSEAEQVA